MEKLRRVVSGGNWEALLEAELSHQPKTVRQNLMVAAGIKVNVPEGQGLAMKASLGLPWNTLRLLRRFKLNKYSVTLYFMP